MKISLDDWNNLMLQHTNTSDKDNPVAPPHKVVITQGRTLGVMYHEGEWHEYDIEV